MPLSSRSIIVLLTLLLLAACIAIAFLYPLSTRFVIAAEHEEIVEKARRDARNLFRDGGENDRKTFPVVMKLSDRTCVELRPRVVNRVAPYVACYDNRTGEVLEERVEIGF